MAKIYGIDQVADHKYACAAALTYWVFRCRDKRRSPAMGIKMWKYLGTSIENAAQASTTIEDYLQELCNSLVSELRPKQLGFVLQTWEEAQVIVRLNSVTREMSEIPTDQQMARWGWRDLVEDACRHAGCFEWDILEVCRTKAYIIRALCNLRDEEDKALDNQNVPDDDEVINITAA